MSSHSLFKNDDAVEESIKCGSLPLVEPRDNEHKLHTDWTIWWDKKAKSKDVAFEVGSLPR